MGKMFYSCLQYFHLLSLCTSRMGDIIKARMKGGGAGVHYTPPLPRTLCYKLPFFIIKSLFYSFFYNSVVTNYFFFKIAKIFKVFKLLFVYSSCAECHSKRQSAYILYQVNAEYEILHVRSTRRVRLCKN